MSMARARRQRTRRIATAGLSVGLVIGGSLFAPRAPGAPAAPASAAARADPTPPAARTETVTGAVEPPATTSPSPTATVATPAGGGTDGPVDAAEPPEPAVTRPGGPPAPDQAAAEGTTGVQRLAARTEPPATPGRSINLGLIAAIVATGAALAAGFARRPHG